MSVLSKPYFHNEEAAFAHLENLIWGDEVVCPHCGGMERITKVKANPDKRIRLGLWRCGDCKGQFTVKVGTVFEHARMPLHKMLQAVYLMTSSKKGVSAHQLHRALEITYKSAWFLAHRIREAMTAGALTPFGGDGGLVEVDETYIGNQKGKEVKTAYHHKMKVLSLVERNSGQARSFVLDKVTIQEIDPILARNVSDGAHLMTDENRVYTSIGTYYSQHSTVNHRDNEYGRGELHTNTIEGFFSIFKRGMKGVYQHCGEQHLHRYLAEFDFRYSNRAKLGVTDTMRADRAMIGIVGKRLTYQTTREQEARYA